MTNQDFILAHRHDDVRWLALRRSPEGVDLRWCLQQIEGRQLAEHKLPQWAETEGLWYPPRVSMEQCSSQQTALYKRQLAERLLPADERESMTDLTGGLGVDFSYVAPLFHRATYVEIQSHLVDLARHNLPLLGLAHATIVTPEGLQVRPTEDHRSADLLYIDPSRRDTVGRKTVALADCSPDIIQLQDQWQEGVRYVLVKLSPMLDISEALRQVRNVKEVHVVSVRGECKELLLLIDPQYTAEPTFHCADLPQGEVFRCRQSERTVGIELGELSEGCLLFEPGSCLLKAACQDAYAHRVGLRKLHPMSNLYVVPSSASSESLSGRMFRVEAWGDFSKRSLSQLLGDLRQANLSVRNFPSSVDTLRKRLRLREGGDTYLFATTLADGRHALLSCARC